MRRIFLLAVIAGILSIASQSFAAQTLTLPPRLATAIAAATMKDSGGTAITGTVSSANAAGDVSIDLSANASSVVSMDFADLSGITSSDFASFDHYFSGLKSLKLVLPDSYTGTFNLSLSSLTALDVSGSTADFNLSIYGFPKLESLKANDCENLKAVNLAEVVPDISYDDTALSVLSDLIVNKGMTSSILSSLKYMDLSNCPKLDRVGYLLSSIPGSYELLERINKYVTSVDASAFATSTDLQVGGYKKHCVVTTLASGTDYERAETSHPVAPSGMSLFETMYISARWSYTGDDVNLLPAIEYLNLNGSGTDASDYITSLDISSLTTLVSADFGGMTSLQSLTLPSSSSLTSLDVTGDTLLAGLDLSTTKGFVFPEGFTTLKGLTSFTMTGRSDLDSIDVSTFTSLLELDLSNNALVSLDLTANTKLKKLYVPNNSMLSLDLSKCPQISNIDLRNNCLTKIDLSSNTAISLDLTSLAANSVRISGQTRTISGDRQRTFDFHDAGLNASDFAKIVATSIKGDGVSATAFDSTTGIATFSSYPSLIAYDYESGLYYDSGINDDDRNRALCMHVRLQWENTSSDVPLLWPLTASISATTGDEITPVVITATSDSAVTWTTTPATIPTGLTMTSDGQTFTISGTANAAYTGTVQVTAQNANGVSETATVSIKITEPKTQREIVPVLYPVSDNNSSNNNDSSGGDSSSGDDGSSGGDSTTPGGDGTTPGGDGSTTPDNDANKAQIVIMSPVSAELTVSVDAEIAPIIINADSLTPVTWSFYPEELPAGLETNVNGKTLVITGTAEEAFSGTILFTATDEAGNSGYTVVKVEITADETEHEPVSEDISGVLPPNPEDVREDDVNGSGGGCNSGLGVIALALLAMRKRLR